MIEPAPIRDDPFARIRLRWLALWLLLSGVAYIGTVLAIGGRNAIDPKADGVAIFSLWAYAAPLLWLVFVCRLEHVQISRIVRAPRSGNWLEAPLLGLAQLAFSLPSFTVLLYLVSLVMPGQVQGLLSHPERLALETGHMAAPAVVVLFVVVAPVVEELLFRGMLFHILASRWGVRPAMLAVAAVFAALHPNPIGMFLFSLMLSVLYLRSRSLIFPILCHMTNNAVPALILLAMPNAPNSAGAASSLASFQHGIAPALLATVLLGGLLVLYLERAWPGREAVMPYFDDSGNVPPPGGDAATGFEAPPHVPEPPRVAEPPHARPDDSENTW